MSDHPLGGAREKLRRGRFHLQSFETQKAAFLKRKPYRTVVEPSDDRVTYTYRARVRETHPASQFGLLVGDAVHNFRATLDHVAWRLTADNDARLSFEDTSVQFPIFRTEVGFNDTRRGGVVRTQRMGANARALIRAVQPYHRAIPRLDALWVLSCLDNIDKHKILPVIASALTGVHFDGKGIPIPAKKSVTITPYLGPIDDNVVVHRIVLAEPDPNFKPEIEPTFDFLFGDIPISEPNTACFVSETLQSISNAVEWTLDLFEPAYRTGVYNDSALVIPILDRGPEKASSVFEVGFQH